MLDKTVLGTLIHKRLVDRDTDTIIIDADNYPITARELLSRSKSIAGKLFDAGVRSGDCVVICLVDNTDTLACMIACWHLSATPTIIDFRTSPDYRSTVSKLVGAKLVLENRHATAAEEYTHQVWNADWRYASPIKTEFPNAKELGSRSALLSLSSGTTGFPKAYVQTHCQVAQRILVRQRFESTNKGTFYTPMTLAFSATRQMVLNYLAFENKVIFGKPLFSASELIEKISANLPDACAFPPPVIRGLIKEVGAQRTPFFPSLKVLRSIGGPASVEDKLSAYRNLSSGYRMSYSSGLTGTATMLAGRDVLEKPETSGRPVDGIRIEVVDPQTETVLPVGEIGKIKVYAPYVSASVLHHISDVGSKEQLGPGWAYPGDLGHLDDAGFLTVTARQDDVIVRGGVNIAPQEVEHILLADPLVDDVAIVGFDDPDYGEEVAAFFVTKSATEEELHALCMRCLSPDRRPRIIKLFEQLPYNLNGKIDRKKLQQLL